MSDETIKKEHIIKLQGKDFVTHAGLLDVAHQKELVGIETEILKIAENVVIVKARAKFKDGKEFTGIGDASKSNVNKMILPHMIRMAETRAVNRALRFGTNIGMCSVEELGGDDKPVKKGTSEPTKTEGVMKCVGCEAEITQKVAEYSQKYWGEQLCMACQKKQKTTEEKASGA